MRLTEDALVMEVILVRIEIVVASRGIYGVDRLRLV